mmetsp:Transcript_13858/g.11843  ORF Transcript_13858/g.11843 Transcript_13858/m.11843 type:complete len:218 (-) Transcript_13858:781-1434(-)|eukprot:CAMPEP_0114583508 /NCGR_PEP_ID=MMETSP0125-20121206/7212_1 /TAXON_ID=485358 ORGANISM="Aristerostoma sp., Strain ATCC 50986" /NCGR_SAMPLE_ID=MMETSP0125 /ASSEMBLY_ACC=CAM_ASM_000245 /LENGTH=217 /DNA_ID=CAMNT_0001776977 /DNA_START=75 /DNA_END=728 /DNA_ORIENTATION=-
MGACQAKSNQKKRNYKIRPDPRDLPLPSSKRPSSPIAPSDRNAMTLSTSAYNSSIHGGSHQPQEGMLDSCRTQRTEPFDLDYTGKGKDFERLDGLQDIDLRVEQVYYENVASGISEEGLPELTELDFKATLRSEADCRWLQNIFCKAESLQTLNLVVDVSTNIGEELTNTLFIHLAKMKKLREIDITVLQKDKAISRDFFLSDLFCVIVAANKLKAI